MPARMIAHGKRLLLLLAAGLMAQTTALAAATNLVANGNFERLTAQNLALDQWQSAGDRDTVQQLTADAGRTGGRSARLVCTQMGKDSPSAHAMICQVGRVSVQRGQWYRISFWSKSEGIRNGAVYVGLNNTRVWNNAGLDDGFYATPEWQRFEFMFQARETLPAQVSRLQFWFKSTGTLWLDDVELVETAGGRQWLPQWATDGVVNFLPNSSFECGAANWGSYSHEPGGWGNHLFRLLGEVTPVAEQNGAQCLKITLDPQTAPVFYFDYFDAVSRPVRRALAANQGWFKVKPGEPLVLSAYLRAARDGTPAQMAIIQAEGRTLSKNVQVGTQWQRLVFAFQPTQPFIFAAVGLDLEASPIESATLWLDRLQLERGTQPTAYQPRQPVETFVESTVPGNLFTKVTDGITLRFRAFDYRKEQPSVSGQLQITDFADRVVFRATNSVPTRREEGISPVVETRRLLAGAPGFYRATWMTPFGTNSIRCALIVPHDGSDSPIGMNHAYPWDFLVQSANLAGISWWRDWSAKWHVVEPEKGRFDFGASDPQIRRVTALGGRSLVLLPFPSANWASQYRPDADASPPKNDYDRRLKRIAFAPADPADFGRYAAAVARQYHDRSRVYQILNESLYTGYSLPRASGHKMEDYLKLAQAGYRAIKSVDTNFLVVGGIGTGPDAGLSLEFIAKGGLQFVDVFDLHLYEPPVPATGYEAAFAELETLMQKHGGPKPVWITEYGCYADDDPACLPVTIGDASMNRSKWPSELAAAEHMVKFTAVTFAHGVRKIFFHAGEGGQINDVDGGGIFFEYGGAPRKMYPAVAALTRLVGTPDESLGSIVQDGTYAYLFRRGQQSVAVTWAAKSKATPIKLPDSVQAFDLMGNPLAARECALSPSPVYLVESSRDAQAIRGMFR